MADQQETVERPSTRAYLDGVLLASDFPVSEISDHLERSEVVVWVDFYRPDADELHELAGELGLHDLAVEDALGPHQRPKVDFYDTHLFLSCHSLQLDETARRLHQSEIDVFVSSRWLVTVRKANGFSMEAVVARWDRSTKMVSFGVSYFLYTLLDSVVDGYFEVVNAFDEVYEDVSEGIFAERPLDPDEQRRWFEMRRSLVRFHRLVVPLREEVSGLMRREHGVIADEMYPYFQDVYDHILRVSESTDSLRELVSTIVETNLSLREYRQNQVMKKVTSWAAIIAVPTLVTGFFGMNVPFPTAGEGLGVVVAVVLMGSLSVALFIAFRRRDWL